jgi:hypothetical protein
MNRMSFGWLDAYMHVSTCGTSSQCCQQDSKRTNQQQGYNFNHIVVPTRSYQSLSSNVPESSCFDYGGQLVAHHSVLIFVFPSPVRRRVAQAGQGILTNMLSTWPRSGSCEFMRKPDQSSNAGNPEGAPHRGRLFFGYFLFGEAKESN